MSAMKRLLVTGSSGLIGSEVVDAFCGDGWAVVGVDNNMRAEFFGVGGSTKWRAQQLIDRWGPLFAPRWFDVRNYGKMKDLLAETKPDAIVHCAGQPSHDLAAANPILNWEVNVTATMQLLEAAREYCPEAAFVFMSSNKVYGDQMNSEVVEQESRYEIADGLIDGYDESVSTDHTCRSIYGASKLAADVLVQEYGTYFGMPTVALRCACMTGANHAGVELHGFLSYMVKCALTGAAYNVNNYKGKQVRDNIAASDVIDLIKHFVKAPTCGQVYNVGGGRGTDVSLLEAQALIFEFTKKSLKMTFNEHPRKGDFIVWVTDMTKALEQWPEWEGVTVSLEAMIGGIVDGWRKRLAL